MKKKAIIGVSVAAAAVVVTGAILGGVLGSRSSAPKLKDVPLTGSMIANFTEGEMPDALFASDGWTNGTVFNTQWSSDCVSLDDGAMHLSLAANPDGDEATNNAYFGGETRSYQFFGYGDYSVKMKPAKKAGTASTFFTYTGPGDEEEGEDPAPHDEIDIEFLGKDTTKVQFNYFVNGVGGHEYWYNLGFDASAEYHEYGYRWTDEYIVWFVDGKPVHKVEASAKNPMPSHPGKIFMNYWCGTTAAHGWMGQYSNPGAESTDYQWVKCSATPIGEIPEKPDDIDTSDVPTEGWENIDYSYFGGWTGYDIDKTDGITVSHTQAMNGWKCEGMEFTQSYSWIKFNIKNNDSGKANIRLDIKQKGQTEGDDGIGGIAGFYCDDEGVVSYDALVAAALINLEGGQSTDIVLKIKDIYVNQLVVFLNSTQASGGAETGSITITDLQGIVNEDVEKPEGPKPDQPVLGEGESLMFTTDNAKYTIDPAEGGKTINVTYSGVAASSYTNVVAGLNDLAQGKTTFTFTVVNNGSSEAVLRVDMTKDNTNCNTAITAVGGDAWQDDSSYFKVAAGKTVNVTITFSGDPTLLVLFIDSTVQTGPNSGDLTFSNFKFTGTSTSPTQPTDPDTDPDKTAGSLDVSDLTFSGNTEIYNVSKNTSANTITVTYESVGGQSYQNIETNIGTIARTYNVFNLKITNNGTNIANVRIDIEGVTPTGPNNKSCNVSATGNGTVVNTDLTWGGSFFTIEAGETIIVAITYDTSKGPNTIRFFIDSSTSSNGTNTNGSVTFSEMKFSGTGSYVPPEPPAVDDDSVAVTFTTDNNYTITNNDDGTVNVSYNNGDITTSSYHNLSANIATAASGKTTLTFTVVNNGENEAYIRADLTVGAVDGTKVGTSATSTGTSYCNHTASDGTIFKIAAGSTATITITYDGSADYLVLFFDSLWDASPKGGNVTLYNFIFS